MQSVTTLWTRWFALAVVAMGLLGVSSVAAPEPEAIPRRWQLQVEAGPLRVMSVQSEGRDAQTYYYMTYKVTNNSGEDISFAPLIELATDDGVITRGGRGVPGEVTDVIRARLGDSLLETESEIQGMLLQGPENARKGLVVWQAGNMKVDEVVVYAAGFSGETKSVQRPDTGEKVVLRKTLMIRHSVPGEIDPSSDQPLKRDVERWILR